MVFFSRVANAIARIMAYLGGTLLIVLIGTICVSVAGRSINTIGNLDFTERAAPMLAAFLQRFRPITGDFELVEMGVALSVFLFLPWCQLNRGHAAVDLFTSRFIKGKKEHVLLFMWEVLLTAIFILVAARLYVGMIDKMRFSETTFLLQWPIWWAYCACLVAASMGVFVALYSVAMRYQGISNPSPPELKTAP